MDPTKKPGGRPRCSGRVSSKKVQRHEFLSSKTIKSLLKEVVLQCQAFEYDFLIQNVN